MAYTEIVIHKVWRSSGQYVIKRWSSGRISMFKEKNKVDIGNIYIGVVKNVVKNINGAFVEFDQRRNRLPFHET